MATRQKEDFCVMCKRFLLVEVTSHLCGSCDKFNRQGHPKCKDKKEYIAYITSKPVQRIASNARFSAANDREWTNSLRMGKRLTLAQRNRANGVECIEPVRPIT